MKSFGFKIFGSLALASLLFTACGGGGGGSAITSSVSTVKGVVSDGPIENARVFIDLNLNGEFDEDEPYDMTDGDGVYEISYIFESQTKYVIIAEGENALDTKDDEDNPGKTLDFFMFDEIVSQENEDITNIVGTVYTKDINPISFKNHLKSYDDELYGGLDTNDTVVSKLLDSTETNETEIFQSFILDDNTNDAKEIMKSKFKELATLVEESNDADRFDSTKSDVSLETDSVMTFSDDNVSDLSNSLLYKTKTEPNKIGSMVISKDIGTPTKTEDNISLFVTVYDQVLEIPQYSYLKENNFTIVTGTDIKALENGVVLSNDDDLENSVLSDFNFPSEDSLVSLLQYDRDSSTWVSRKDDVNITTLNTLDTTGSNFTLEPFVVIKKDTFTKKTYIVDNFNAYSKPVVIAKGHFADGSVVSGNLLSGTGVTIDAGELDENGSVSLNIPAGFIVDEIVVVSEDLVDVTPTAKASVKLDVDENGTVEQDANSISSLLILEDTNDTKVDILTGNLMNGMVGIESMIDTNILYTNLVVSLNFDKDASVKSILLNNINSFLGGSNSFSSSNDLTYNGGKLEVDASAKTLKLTESNASAQTTIIWNFEINNTVTRTKSQSFDTGSKAGSIHDSSYTFEYQKGVGSIVVKFKDSRYETDDNGDEDVSYEGVAIFERDANDDIGRLISSDFTQKHTQVSKLGKKNVLNGVVRTSENNLTTADVLDNNLSFEGEFELYSDTYTLLEGSIKIYPENATTTKSNSGKSDNTISKAVVIITPPNLVKSTIIVEGLWNGTFTSSCVSENGLLNVDFNNNTWNGSEANGTMYVGKMTIDGNTSNLKISNETWGILKAYSSTDVNGTWNYNGCDGNITLSKQ